MSHADILDQILQQLNLPAYSTGGRLKVRMPDNSQVHLAIVQVKPAGKCLTCPALIDPEKTHCDYCEKEMT